MERYSVRETNVENEVNPSKRKQGNKKVGEERTLVATLAEHLLGLDLLVDQPEGMDMSLCDRFCQSNVLRDA